LANFQEIFGKLLLLVILFYFANNKLVWDFFFFFVIYSVLRIIKHKSGWQIWAF
jgi:hypothetical protein